MRCDRAPWPQMTRSRASRFGVTLVELVVVLAVLGTVAAVTAPALPRQLDRSQGALRDSIAVARAVAASTGRPATRLVPASGAVPSIVTAWPSGLVLVDSARRTRVVNSEGDDARP